MHPAKEGFSSLPFFDEFDLSTVDILLISQYVRFPRFPCLRWNGIGGNARLQDPVSLRVHQILAIIDCFPLLSCLYRCMDCCNVLRYRGKRKKRVTAG